MNAPRRSISIKNLRDIVLFPEPGGIVRWYPYVQLSLSSLCCFVIQFPTQSASASQINKPATKLTNSLRSFNVKVRYITNESHPFEVKKNIGYALFILSKNVSLLLFFSSTDGSTFVPRRVETDVWIPSWRL